ncbi:MAG: hypothetical protein VZR53_03205 [Prevotella sp.]|nr:hypothetical protein [Prevotella sp.]
MRLINEGYLSSVIGEDDDPQDPNAQGGAPADPMAGGADAQGGAPADTMGGQDPMGGADGGADPMAGGDPMGGAEGPMDMDMDEPDLDGGNPEDLEDDNTVIDVEDIVQAQEKLNKKENEIGKDVSSLGTDYTKLLAALEKMQKTIDAQDQRMSQLSNELEKRIPTQQERLQMQSLKSYPFNIDPNEYWNEKEKDGDYKATDEPRDNKPLEIKQKMIDNYNASEIEDSFENPSTKDIFKGFY